MKMNKSLLCAGIALVVSGGLLAGCSKSDDTSADNTTAPVRPGKSDKSDKMPETGGTTDTTTTPATK